MKKVFISGCFDIIHGGHVEFFQQAKKYGDWLTVCIASDRVLNLYKHRKSSLSIEHKLNIIKHLDMVNEVCIGDDVDNIGLNFRSEFLRIKPDFLIVTDDDKFEEDKLKLCESINCKYIKLGKTLDYQKISTSDIINYIKCPKEVPLRVDFAGGWLDVPKYSIKDGYIINCTITPMVSLDNWIYNTNSGLGGSAAYSILLGRDSVKSELDLGVGWQDPAVIQETGLCVWRSGSKPVLHCKYNPDFLNERMALYWTGNKHDTPNLVDNKRNYKEICMNSKSMIYALKDKDYDYFYDCVNYSYQMQLDEGMQELPNFRGELCRKYVGGGHGGYSVHIFEDYLCRNIQSDIKGLIRIEPYIRSV